MSYEVRNKYISAGATAFCLAVLLVFLLLCGFTHKTPPDPPAEEMVVEVQEIELEDLSGGGNMMDGGNYNPNNPKPALEVKETPSKTSQNNNTPTTNTATSPTGPKANVPEQPKPNNNAMFGSDKVGSGQTPSTAGGTTSGNGGANGHGDGLGLGNDAGTGGGTNTSTCEPGGGRTPALGATSPSIRTNPASMRPWMRLREKPSHICTSQVSSRSMPVSGTTSRIMSASPVTSW